MRNFIIISGLLLIVYSCSDSKESLNTIPVADFKASDLTDAISLIDNSYDADGNALTCKWSSTTPSIVFSNMNENKTYVSLCEENIEADITLTVDDGKSESSITKSVTIPKSTLIRKYGLGKKLINERSNNVAYDWYYDQAVTGQFSDINCGPSSVTMAIKWANEAFTGTPQDARNTFRPSGGWWYTTDIKEYLTIHDIGSYYIDLSSIDNIKKEIDNSNIVILCLDMFFIRKEKNKKWHVDKFYNTDSGGWGHFIVVKGYKFVDNELYYEVYDPWSNSQYYPGGSLKGIDRYYRGEDLDEATNLWWDYAIVVTKSKNSRSKGIDPGKIPHKSGR